MFPEPCTDNGTEGTLISHPAVSPTRPSPSSLQISLVISLFWDVKPKGSCGVLPSTEVPLHSYFLFIEKGFSFLDLSRVSKSRLKQLTIMERKDWRNKGKAVKKEN